MSVQKEVIGQCTLYCGDALEVLPTLGVVDACITDPPYGVLVPGDYTARIRDVRGGKHGLVRSPYEGYEDTYDNFCRCVIPALRMSLTLARRAAVFSGPHLQEQPKAAAIGCVYIPAGGGRHVWGFKTFLPVLFYGKAPELEKGARPNTLYSTAIAEKTGHPTTKPLAWMQWLVDLASLRGESILDPFMGSGTTGVACIQAGRSFIGIELVPQYFDLACRRVEDASAQTDLFLPEPSRPQQLILC